MLKTIIGIAFYEGDANNKSHFRLRTSHGFLTVYCGKNTADYVSPAGQLQGKKLVVYGRKYEPDVVFAHVLMEKDSFEQRIFQGISKERLEAIKWYSSLDWEELQMPSPIGEFQGTGSASGPNPRGSESGLAYRFDDGSDGEDSSNKQPTLNNFGFKGSDILEPPERGMVDLEEIKKFLSRRNSGETIKTISPEVNLHPNRAAEVRLNLGGEGLTEKSDPLVSVDLVDCFDLNALSLASVEEELNTLRQAYEQKASDYSAAVRHRIEFLFRKISKAPKGEVDKKDLTSLKYLIAIGGFQKESLTINLRKGRWKLLKDSRRFLLKSLKSGGPRAVAVTDFGKGVTDLLVEDFVDVLNRPAIRLKLTESNYQECLEGSLTPGSPSVLAKRIEELGHDRCIIYLQCEKGFPAQKCEAFRNLVLHNRIQGDKFLRAPIDLPNAVIVVSYPGVVSPENVPLERLVILDGYSVEGMEQIVAERLMPKLQSDHPEVQVKLSREALRYLALEGYSVSLNTLKAALLLSLKEIMDQRWLDGSDATEPICLEQSDLIKALAELKGPVRVQTAPEIGGQKGVAMCVVVMPEFREGRILPVEVTILPKEETEQSLILTGNLEESIQESCRIAYTYLKAKHSEELIGKSCHVNFDEPQVPKKGGSGGVAIAMAMTSELIGEQIPEKTTFTGMLGLKGDIKRVSSVESKIIAALKLNYNTIYIPKKHDCRPSVLEDLRQYINVVEVSHIDEVLSEVFPGYKYP